MGGWDKNRHSSPRKSTNSREESPFRNPPGSTKDNTDSSETDIGMGNLIQKTLTLSKAVINEGGDKQVVERLGTSMGTISENQIWISGTKKWKRRARDKGTHATQNPPYCNNAVGFQATTIPLKSNSPKKKRAQRDIGH